MTAVRHAATPTGTIRAPASKSSMQRAVACAALASGTSLIRGGELCDDSRAALDLAGRLGAIVSQEGEGAFRLTGSPWFSDGVGNRGRAVGGDGALVLDCGESGLCMRMFSPVAALLDADIIVTGRGSLMARPMGMVARALEAFGCRCSTEGGLPPLGIRGPLTGGSIEIDAGESSQLLTGLLVALPLAGADSTLIVRNTVSRGYLDLTIATCAAFGVAIRRNGDFSRFDIAGRQRYISCDFDVEGDWSGAAFLVVAGAISGGLAIGGLNLDSTQPDRAVLEAARAAGADISIDEDGNLSVKQRALRGFEFDATDCPDLFPPLAALAAACEGVSVIRGTHRLRGKESDRAASIVAMLAALGVEARLEGDEMLVRGGRIRGGAVDAAGDHRIAMAAATAALAAGAPVAIQGAECVAKSWPGFFRDLDSILR